MEKHGAKWCPTGSVEAFIQEIGQCKWVITAEGGAHVAGALGLGVILLSGMGHRAYWRPYARFVKILEQKDAINAIEPAVIVSAFGDLTAQMQALQAPNATL